MCAAKRLFDDCSKPVRWQILPKAIPPLGLLLIAKSNKVHPVETNHVKSAGVSSIPIYATLLVSLNFLFKSDAIKSDNSSCNSCLAIGAEVFAIYVSVINEEIGRAH